MTSLLADIQISDSFQQGLDSLVGFLPRLLGFLLILGIGFIVARVVKGILTKVLDKRRPRPRHAHRFNRPVREQGGA